MTANEPPLRSRTARLGLVVALTGVAVVATFGILLLRGDGSDPRGDVRVVEALAPDAPAPSASETLADIVRASVGRDGSTLLFRATVASPIPPELDESSLEFRFDLSEEDRPAWTVAAAVAEGATASLVSQTSAYGSSTIDGTMPGSVSVAGDTITIALQVSRVEAFPDDFDWVLATSLVGTGGSAGSVRFEDRYPDGGSASGP